MKILITGGNKGLGYSLIRQLIKKEGVQNLKIDFTSRDRNRGKEILKELEQEAQEKKIILQNFNFDLTNRIQVKDFVNLQVENKVKYDVVVNNAGLFNKPEDKFENAQKNLDVNYFSTKEFTEQILNRNLLNQQGKIIFHSAIMGQLKFQKKPLQEKLNDSQFCTNESLNKLAYEYLQQIKENKLDPQFSKQSYNFSKCLLNAFIRHIGPSLLKENQQMFALHPGWCKTDLGGKTAPLEADQGVQSTIKLITETPFIKNNDLNCKFFDDKVNVWAW